MKSLSRIIFALNVVLTLANTGTDAQQGSRCPAGDTGCTIGTAPENMFDRVGRAGEKVWDAAKEKKVEKGCKEILEAGKYVVKCGFDALRQPLGDGR